MATKNIVLCSDGTGNTGGKGHGTNVWRIYNAIDIHAHRFNGFVAPDGDAPEEQILATEQLAFYDDGVGTERFKLVRLLFGAVGFGLGRKVRTLYVRLARNYNPGDHIYLYGFSRGAFTVRTLCGMITECGILDRSHPDVVVSDKELKRHAKMAYRAYRYKYEALLTKPINYVKRRLGWLQTAREFRDEYAVTVGDDAYLRSDYPRVPIHAKCEPPWVTDTVEEDMSDGDRASASDFLKLDHEKRVPIRFLGVWDTVDAVGLPSDWLTALVNKVFYRFKFDNRTLSEWVNKACHALAIDEQRRSFAPVLFDENHAHKEGVNEPPSETVDCDGDRIEQVWFAGVHSNVGGGYAKQQLAKVSQYWMMRKSAQAGLQFIPGQLESVKGQCNSQGRLYDSRSGFGIYYICKPRNITQLAAENCQNRANVHVSAYQRIALATDDYAPGNLPKDVNIVSTDHNHVGEDQTSLRRLAQDLTHCIGEHPPMMAHVNNYERVSRVFHWIFYAVAIYALACTQAWLNEGVRNLTGYSLSTMCPAFTLTILNDVFGQLSPMMHITLVFGGIGFLMYMVDSMLRQHYSNRCSSIWREVGPMKEPWWRPGSKSAVERTLRANRDGGRDNYIPGMNVLNT